VCLLIGLPCASQIALALLLDSLCESFLSPLGGILREGYDGCKPDDSNKANYRGTLQFLNPCPAIYNSPIRNLTAPEDQIVP
jgi:hypothetical protein